MTFIVGEYILVMLCRIVGRVVNWKLDQLTDNFGFNNPLIMKSVIESGYINLKYEGHNEKFIPSRGDF
jgi:hypothetical protein